MFRNRTYKIKFKKTYQTVSWGTWKEVTDNYILYILGEIQKKYNFKIINVKLKGCFDHSYIVIQCNKDDKYNIFNEFCTKLSGQIENVCI